jgi:arabinofuranosyltransferase
MSNRLILLSAMFAAALMLLATAWIGDDAFITLRVIDNFVNGYGLRYNAIERVQVYTHPLWLMFLTPLYWLSHEAMVTTMLASVLVSLLALWVVATRVARNIAYGSLIVLAAMASTSICQFSTSGLETPLTFLLLGLMVWQLGVGDDDAYCSQPKRAVIPAGIAGLLLLNRLDLVMLVGPLLGYLVATVDRKERVKLALLAVFPALAWMAFSVLYYGSPFPNTAYAKLGTGYGAWALGLQGLEYCKDFAIHDPLLAAIIGKAAFDALRCKQWYARSLGAGIVLYVAYVIAVGGDFMSGRFFAPPGFLALCVLAKAPVPQWLSGKSAAVAFIIAAVAATGLLMARVEEPMRYAAANNGSPRNVAPRNGIADERAFYYADNGLLPVLMAWVATGSEPVHPWGQWGLAFRSRARIVGRTVVFLDSDGNVGMPGYYAGPAVHVLDVMALTDAFLARLPALPGARIGHYTRRLPPGYASTLLSDAPTTDVESLNPLLKDVLLATRAPLFAEGRTEAIWRLLSGEYSGLYGDHGLGAKQ